jgi:CubicO group peptidase (beta-lactamase class C family)
MTISRSIQTFVLALLLTLLSGCASHPQPRPDYNAVSLLTLTPSQQLSIYKDIEDTFVVKVAKRGNKVAPLPHAKVAIAPQIEWQSKQYSIDAFMTEARMTGVLVIKNGEVVLERYALGRKPEDRWTSFSVGKSVTSTLLGAAIKDGYIKSLDEPVAKYIPELKGSGYDKVNIRQLITMTSGVKWNEDYNDPNSDVAQSSIWQDKTGMNPLVSYMRRLPNEAAPGTKFVYKTGETDMAGILVARATGKGLAQYLSEKVWRPYGMERDAIWMVDRGDMERGGCCISITLRDYGRFAMFMAGGGKIGDHEVLPSWWMAEATTNRLKPPAQGNYGYFWWTRDDGFDAYGIFGQSISFYPKDNLIVVINSAAPQAVGREFGVARMALMQSILKATQVK